MDVKYTIKLFMEYIPTGEIVEFNKKITKKKVDVIENESVFVDQKIITDYFKRQIDKFEKENSKDELVIDGYEISSNTKNINIYFDSESVDDLDIEPRIMAYYSTDDITQLYSEQIGNYTTRWYWDDDKKAHYIVDEEEAIIAHLPIGVNEYIESDMMHNTVYSRFLISYDNEFNHLKSNECNITLSQIKDNVVYKRYFQMAKRHEEISPKEKKVTKRLKAFKTGIGDFDDCKIEKPKDLTYIKKFKIKNKIYGLKATKGIKKNTVKFFYRYKLEGIVEEATYDANYEIVATRYTICDRRDEPNTVMENKTFSVPNMEYSLSKDCPVHEIYMKSLFPDMSIDYSERYQFDITVRKINGSLNIVTHPYGIRKIRNAVSETVTFTLKGYFDTLFRIVGEPVICEKLYEEYYPPLINQPYVTVVNGDFESSEDGKKNFEQLVPYIDHPPALKNRKIYCLISKIQPEQAYVQYRFKSDKNNDGFTKVQNDTIEFYSDSIMPDGTIDKEFICQIDKGYYIINDYKLHEYSYDLDFDVDLTKYKGFEMIAESSTDDVKVLTFDKTIIPDNDGHVNKSMNVGVRAIQSALAKWNPYIHNGYYYYNQDEYYLFTSTNQSGTNRILENVFFKTPITLNVGVRVRDFKTNFKEYEINFNDKDGLLLDPTQFVFENGYVYPKYESKEDDCEWYADKYVYYSKPMSFEYKVTDITEISWDEYKEGGELKVGIQSFNEVNGEWDKPIFINKGEPLPDNIDTSTMYRFLIEIYTKNTPPIVTYRYDINSENKYIKYGEKYHFNNLYLNEEVAVPKSPLTEAIYITKVFDMGNSKEVNKRRAVLPTFYYHGDVKLYMQCDDDRKEIAEKLNQSKWVEIKNNEKTKVDKRYVKFKVVIAPKSSLLSLHLRLDRYSYKGYDKKEYIPGFSNLKFKCKHEPKDSYTTYSNSVVDDLPFDARMHAVILNLKEFVASILRPYGQIIDNVVGIKIEPYGFMNDKFYVKYDKDVSIGVSQEPVFISSYEVLEDQELADENYEGVSFTVPGDGKVSINPIPQQYAPVILYETEYERNIGEPYTEVFFTDDNNNNYILENTEVFKSKGFRTYYLQYTNIDTDSVKVYVEDFEHPEFKITDNVIDLLSNVSIDAKVTIKYKLLNSFCVNYDYENDEAIFEIHKDSNEHSEMVYKVYYETNKSTALRKLKHVSLNPIYNCMYNGYIFISEDENIPNKINISPLSNVTFANGIDETVVIVQLLDKFKNPVKGYSLDVYAEHGNIIKECDETDSNGVLKCKYISYDATIIDTIHAELKSHGLNSTCKMKNIKVDIKLEEES